MQRPARLAVLTWLAFVLACGIIISRSHFTTDLSAFLPSNPTAEQRLLMDQLKDGLVSRLILVGIEGAEPEIRAALSKKIAQQLRGNPAFATVNNGEPVNLERDREFLFNNRYLLSPAVTPERFTVDGLNDAIGESIDMLASPAGLLTKSLLPRDPSGEMLQLLQQLGNNRQPRLLDGAWSSRDGKTALLLAQTKAAGSDTDAQQRAMEAIQSSFDAARKTMREELKLKLVMSGPGVFSVEARDSIKSQVRLIFVISSIIIAGLLLLLYRSLPALALGFLPVITGILAGIAAVSLGFGVVHGITLGFGTALIGEAVDYSIYLFIQSGKGETGRRNWIDQYWPTVRLGVLTSVFGFASLLLSGFPGLAQLGLYSISGLIAAAVMTRFVLPHLLPANFHIRDVKGIGLRLSQLARRAPALKGVAVILLIAACVILYLHRTTLWNHELSSLSPVPRESQLLDAHLRTEMGAPDVRYVVVVSGRKQQAVLHVAEQVSAALQPLVEQGKLSGFESPSRYLPSLATQKARRSALPATDELRARLQQAVKDLPIKAERMELFLADAEKARTQRLLVPSDLHGTSMEMATNALLIASPGKWSALLPLAAPAGGNIDAAIVQDTIRDIPGTLFIDLKTESNKLYSGYLYEAIGLSLGGLAAIIGLLLFVLLSPARVLHMITPLAAAVVIVAAGLVLAGKELIILHLVGLLLVVAIGSNYTLFFDPPKPGPMEPQTYASLLFANIGTVIGFGLLAFSTVPVLQALGMTVAPGVILALIFAAIFARRQDSQAAQESQAG